MRSFLIALGGVGLILFSGVSLAATPPKGVYSGKFGDAKITIFIDSFKKGRVSGRSLYKQNDRPITGTITGQGNFWHLKLNEPATRTGDGSFDITANRSNPNVLIGKWTVFPATDSRKGIPSKTFTLNQTKCHYDPSVGQYPESSRKILNDDDLYEEPFVLSYIRNEIFARHGYSFKSTQWAAQFDTQDWYTPCYTDVSNKLTDIEKKNIKRLKEMEAYMRKHPEYWSR